MPIEIIRKAGKNSLNNLIKQFASRYEISVGLPKGSVNYPSEPDDPKKNVSRRTKKPLISVIQTAYWNEFGIGVPERSFLRSTINAQKDKYKDRAGSIVKKALADKDYNIERNVGLLGQEAEKDVKQKITDTHDPPNAEETIKKKGSDHPLIDTGLLRQSVRNVVKKL